MNKKVFDKKMKKIKKTLAFLKKGCYNSFCCDGVWRSLVARTAGGREVAGSNPVAPIFKIKGDKPIYSFVYWLIFI